VNSRCRIDSVAYEQSRDGRLTRLDRADHMLDEHIWLFDAFMHACGELIE
jgi:hypothetical protein